MKKLFSVLSLILVIGLCFTSCNNTPAELKVVIDEENANCPQAIESGLMMTRVFDDGSNIVFECEVDENLYEIESLFSLISETKEIMAEIITSDEDFTGILDLIISSKRGVIYRYKGKTSGETCDIPFSNSELKELSLEI